MSSNMSDSDLWCYQTIFSAGIDANSETTTLIYRLVSLVTLNPWQFDDCSDEEKIISKMKNICCRCHGDMSTPVVHHNSCDLGFLGIMGLLWQKSFDELAEMDADRAMFVAVVQNNFTTSSGQ